MSKLVGRTNALGEFITAPTGVRTFHFQLVFCVRNSYQMQRYCINEELSALDKMRKFAETHPSGEPAKIQQRCAAKWQDAKKRADFRMIVYCTDQEMKAYQVLQR